MNAVAISSAAVLRGSIQLAAVGAEMCDHLAGRGVRTKVIAKGIRPHEIQNLVIVDLSELSRETKEGKTQIWSTHGFLYVNCRTVVPTDY